MPFAKLAVNLRDPSPAQEPQKLTVAGEVHGSLIPSLVDYPDYDINVQGTTTEGGHPEPFVSLGLTGTHLDAIGCGGLGRWWWWWSYRMGAGIGLLGHASCTQFAWSCLPEIAPLWAWAHGHGKRNTATSPHQFCMPAPAVDGLGLSRGPNQSS